MPRDPTKIANSAAARLAIGLDEQPGDQIGPYKLRERLGEGGFGTVWQVEQQEPVARQAALKIIKLGMDTCEVIARFEAERQALALMEHPNIATVHDAGTTETGRPYFVMELVRGIPINEFCELHNLGLQARLGVFLDICAALNHAHQKGVIHRDLKPSNVLVALDGDQPVPKIIDFGIAKATGANLTGQTLHTRADQVVGTPLYMAPEQLGPGSVDIDTRVDIYALGALLYECTTGSPPLDPALVSSANFEEIRRNIRTHEPEKPSARIGEKHSPEKQRLARQLRGDLDWIILKALEKDRSRRYETAYALLLDIRRYLAGDNVDAAPPSVSYRLKKTIRRHRLALATASVIATALIASTAVSLWQANNARIARDASEDSLQFLIDSFRSADSQTTIATVLERAAKQLQQGFGDSPESEIKLLAAVADAHSASSMHLGAEPLRRRAITLAEQHLPLDSRVLFQLRLDLSGDIISHKRGEAEAIARRLLVQTLDQFGPADPLTIQTRLRLARIEIAEFNAERSPGNAQSAERATRDAHRAAREHLGAGDPVTLACLGQIAALHHLKGESAKAAETYTALIAAHAAEENPPLSHYEQLLFMSSYHQDLHRYSEAEPFARRALEGHRRLLGEHDPKTCAMRSNLAWILVALHQHEEASALIEQNLQIAARRPEDFAGHAAAVADLAHYRENRGRPAEAVALHRQALQIVASHVPDDHHESLRHIGTLLRALFQLTTHGDVSYLAEADDLAGRLYGAQVARRAADPTLPPPSPHPQATVRRLQGRIAEASTILSEALAATTDQPLVRPAVLQEAVMTHIALDELPAAAAFARQLYDLDPEAVAAPHTALRLALLQNLTSGGADHGALYRQQASRIAGSSDDSHLLAATAGILLLAPPPLPPKLLEGATTRLRRALEINPSNFHNIVCAATAEILTNTPQQAIDRLAPYLDHRDWRSACPALAVAARAHQASGNAGEAAQLYTLATARWQAANPLASYDDTTLDAYLLSAATMALAKPALDL